MSTDSPLVKLMHHLTGQMRAARLMFWTCPVDEHRNRDAVTVEWRDGVAYCTYPGCGNSSDGVSAATPSDD